MWEPDQAQTSPIAPVPSVLYLHAVTRDSSLACLTPSGAFAHRHLSLPCGAGSVARAMGLVLGKGLHPIAAARVLARQQVSLGHSAGLPEGQEREIL